MKKKDLTHISLSGSIWALRSRTLNSEGLIFILLCSHVKSF